MIDEQLSRKGVSDPELLAAFRAVPREEFVPEGLREFAHRACPLPIGHEQTISQPFVAALMIDALKLDENARVLEVGAGSGYAAAVMSCIAADVYAVERVAALAVEAKERLARLAFNNVYVLCGDGALGWPEFAPYDGIAVASGGLEPPPRLLKQLAVGGRLVMPLGPGDTTQTLTRFTRNFDGSFSEEAIADVRFVPVVGPQGWEATRRPISVSGSPNASVSRLIAETATSIESIESAELGAVLERAGAARVVLLGESTCGTSEFYRMRTRITQELVQRYNFDFVAVEADWPDASQFNSYVLAKQPEMSQQPPAFSHFPQWRWRNREVTSLIEWMRARNTEHGPRNRVGFHGLDLYSMFTSISAVLHYLDDVDPDAARVARTRYGLLTPWQKDPCAYGRAVLTSSFESCEETVLETLAAMLEQRLTDSEVDGAPFFDASQNAHLIANAERYYREMYYGEVASWNLRDAHMFETLESLLAFYGPKSRGIVWEHNSHVGNLEATEMSGRGKTNVGQQCRARFGDGAYIIGFGTDHGVVGAASTWGGEMQRMQLRPSHADSYGRVFHDSGVPAFSLHLRDPVRRALRDELMVPRLERAIGVIYRPEAELFSHYFEATLPEQFDELIWIDATDAVDPQGQTDVPSLTFSATQPIGD